MLKEILADELPIDPDKPCDGTNHPVSVYLVGTDNMHVLTAIDKQNMFPANRSSSTLFNIFHKP